MSSVATESLKPDTLHFDVSLAGLNTFGLAAKAARYYRATSVASLQDILRQEQPELVLGGGSNMLLTRDIEGLVLHVDLRGKHMLSESEHDATLSLQAHEVIVEAGAGEGWHDFVLYTLGEGLGGLENLSLIPGSVGASPIQNIGAYGVEIKDHFVSLDALDRATLEVKRFTKGDCAFGYRSSVFKQELRGRYIILSVRFRLSAKQHVHRLDYGDVRRLLEEAGAPITPRAISEAVQQIRRSKLPDPAEIGNSGSFFKNPELSASEFEQLRQRRPDVRYYELPDGRYKVPAGWLIDQAGWKGYRDGAIGVHDRQALVLVNHGGGKGADLWALAQRIQADVQEKFGVKLTPEVNVY